MKFARRRQNYIFEVFAGVIRCGYEHSLFSMSELLVILSVSNSPRRELRDNGVAKKFAILTPKLRSRVRIFISRTWAISLKLLRYF